ncbi:MAG: hypothetical protein M4579_007183 [Chaenotheca gracillima]|nr:MAG: hypothetical protein M4579_007183 [Chaenotheca gracillima]
MDSSGKYHQIYTDRRSSSSTDEGLASDRGLLEKDFRPLTRKQTFFKFFSNRAIAIHFFIFVLQTLLMVIIAYTPGGAAKRTHLIYTPANEALEYQAQIFNPNAEITELYASPPSPEVDKAWHDLLNDINVRISGEDLDQLGRKDAGVALPDGSGYLGTLNVYHELHCVKRLKQYMYPEYYWPDLTKDEILLNRLHNEHCIDLLRQAAMCHGDAGLITFYWDPSSRIPMANATNHVCVDWNRLDTWTRSRAVDMMEPGLLIHPTLGPAYPDGEGDRIGAIHGKKQSHDAHMHGP